MRIIVTGGAGFIETAVCRHFVLELGHEVVVVDKLTYAGNLASLTPVASSPHYSFGKFDICDVDGISALMQSTPQNWKLTAAGALKRPSKRESRRPYAGISSAPTGGNHFARMSIEVIASDFN